MRTVSSVVETERATVNPGEKRGPAKCRSPRRTRKGGFKERWCVALDAVMSTESNDRRAGIAVVQGIKLSTGEPFLFGVAARRSAKAIDRAIFFNVCPFCGERLDWNVKSGKRKKKARR